MLLILVAMYLNLQDLLSTCTAVNTVSIFVQMCIHNLGAVYSIYRYTVFSADSSCSHPCVDFLIIYQLHDD